MSLWQRIRETRVRLRPRPLARLRPAEPSAVDLAYVNRPDLARRRAFLAEHLFLQTHIAKTAGTAFFDGVASIVGATHALDVRSDTSVPVDDISAEDMADIQLVSGHFVFGVHRRFDRRPLYIASVRDPVDRAVSIYRYARQSQKLDPADIDFETFWHTSDRASPEKLRNTQTRVLMGHRTDRAPHWNDVLDRIEHDYFLIVPQPRVSEAVRRLRTAFGVPFTRSPRSNVTRGEPVAVSEAMRQTILGANASDARLYAHIDTTFDDRLARASRYIASNCLAQRTPGTPKKDATR